MEALGAQRKIRLVLRGERVDKSSPAEEPQRAATSLWQAYQGLYLQGDNDRVGNLIFRT